LTNFQKRCHIRDQRIFFLSIYKDQKWNKDKTLFRFLRGTTATKKMNFQMQELQIKVVENDQDSLNGFG
jgi:hypothetical protein